MLLPRHSDSIKIMTSQMLKLAINSTTNCKFCGKAFKSIAAAKNHEREIHKFTLLHCTVCSKECMSKLILRNHMKMHEKRKCSQCNIELNGNNYLKHEAKHKGLTEKKKMSEEENIVHQLKNKVPCRCKFCNKDFQWIKSKVKHEKICQDSLKIENAFKCSLCDKSYQWRKKSLTRHMTGNHK